jgi:NADH:ubiquinone oxidoreductase subunit B-like Fe-S oxidoreductase
MRASHKAACTCSSTCLCRIGGDYSATVLQSAVCKVDRHGSLAQILFVTCCCGIAFEALRLGACGFDLTRLRATLSLLLST